VHSVLLEKNGIHFVSGFPDAVAALLSHRVFRNQAPAPIIPIMEPPPMHIPPAFDFHVVIGLNNSAPHYIFGLG
jgi:hypothetical protein